MRAGRGCRVHPMYLLATLIVGLLRLPTLGDRLLNLNEGIFLAQASRLTTLDAWLYPVLYRIETKTQVGLAPFRLAQLLGSSYTVLILRLECLLALLIGSWLLIAFSRRFWGCAAPGLLAALTWATYVTLGPGYPLDLGTVADTFLGANLEYFQVPLILAALYATVAGAGGRGGRPCRARAWLVGAGLAAGGSTLIKGSTMLLVPALLAALGYLAVGRPRVNGRQLAGDGACLLAGAAVPVAVFAPYLSRPEAAGELAWQLTAVIPQYDAGAPGWGLRAVLLALGLPLGWWGLVLAGRGRRLRHPARGQTPARRVVIAVFLAAAAVGLGCLPGWGYWYYLIALVPVGTLALSGWLAWARPSGAASGTRRGGWARGIVYLLTLAPAAATWGQSWSADPYRASAAQRYDVAGVLAAIAATRPTDAIWVYYNAPELYLWSGRTPATRDPAGGYVAYLWDAAISRRIATDLTAAPPALIIGIAEPLANRGPERTLLQIPELGAWIAAHYHCAAGQVRGVILCQPRPPDRDERDPHPGEP